MRNFFRRVLKMHFFFCAGAEKQVATEVCAKRCKDAVSGRRHLPVTTQHALWSYKVFHSSCGAIWRTNSTLRGSFYFQQTVPRMPMHSKIAAGTSKGASKGAASGYEGNVCHQ